MLTTLIASLIVLTSYSFYTYILFPFCIDNRWSSPRLRSRVQALTLSSVHAASDHHHGHGNKHRSAKHQDTDTYEIVFPQIVDNENGILVDDVTSYTRRRKRGSGFDEKPLQISISGSGENFQLELWENDILLAPGFKIYRRKTLHDNVTEDTGRGSTIQSEAHGCHFTGHVKSHDKSPASISICNGMNGLIRTTKDDYLIEPMKEATVRSASGFVGQPHKLYKRSLLDTKHQNFFEAQNSGSQSVTVEQPAGEEGEPHRVHKRAAYKYKFLRQMNSAKTVEMLVVVDKNMYHEHGDQNITTYTLTLFNMVSQLFKDGSLGNRINIVLVGLILLEGDERGLSIDYNADDTLNSFCSWQSVLVGANGRQHDHAILLTGLDLCSYKNSPCDTLGFAPIEGMCNRVRSCTVNEDTGLSTAFTIAHEVGHNFGMFHDGEGNYCTQSAGKIMSPTLMGKDGQFHWSVCSKAYLMRFLNTAQSDCLDDKPKQVAELKFPDKLPGELYSADIQCKWQFGSRARLCTYDFGKDICKALWCYRGNKRCETKFLPAAEGTSCGHGKWCRQGECVGYGHNGPKPINGAWSPWSEWSECSRSCGGGIMQRERECSRPLPQYGGKPCDGEDKVYKMCNVQECPDDSEDFHSVQCSTYNKQPFQGWYLQWKPQKKLHNVNEPCKLHCVADTPSYVFTIKHTATNGMQCGTEDDHICVEGACRSVGCDWIVGSDVHNDICGVCKGDNSTCQIIRGVYNEQPKLNTYFPITILPKSARSIRIREKSLSSNYLAVRNIFGTYFLNGQQRVAWPGKYKLGGANFKYMRPYNEPETLEAEGPLEEELVLEILVQDRNPGIEYQYTVPKSHDSEEQTETSSDQYSWSVSISSCSEPCAGGEKTVSAICNRNFDTEVDPRYCHDVEKPETGVFPCNKEPCEPRWVPAEWKACSKTCGGGKQRRRIYCRQKISKTKDKKLKKKFCNKEQKPTRKRICNEQECPPAWHTGKWSECSLTCGGGERKRRVTCRSKGSKGRKKLPDSMCHSSKPDTHEACRTKPCPDLNKYDWLLSPWGPCSKTCGEGFSSRYLRCTREDDNRQPVIVEDHFCRSVSPPSVPMSEACSIMACPQAYRLVRAQWRVGGWSQCSRSCEAGTQSRMVSCVDERGQSADYCDEKRKPPTSRPCDNGACPPIPLAMKGCVDKYKWCFLVPQNNVCDNHLYKENCCLSCSGR